MKLKKPREEEEEEEEEGDDDEGGREEPVADWIRETLPWSNIEPAARCVAPAEVLNALKEPFGQRRPSDRSLTIPKTFL